MQMLEALLLCIPKSELKLSSSFGFRWSRKSNPTVARVPEAECPAHKVVVQGFGRVVGLEEIRPLLHQAKAQHTHTQDPIRKASCNPETCSSRGVIWEFPKIRGTEFWGPYKKDPLI